MEYQWEYRRWCELATEDQELQDELRAMNETPIEDAFYRNLAFGTGGLRGLIGAGTNRMNVYTVAKASQGLANAIKRKMAAGKIAISYDSRIKSELFAQVAAGVFAANGLTAYIYPRLMPTPCLSFAVRQLGCDAGVMITASHNPACYNGYKVYGSDGCQITTHAADAILAEIEALDLFADVRRISFAEGIAAGRIRWIGEEVYTAFIETVKAQGALGTAKADKDISIVYTPLNGAGLQPVLRMLHEAGYANITVVKEQEQPDGKFPTCPYPNPEVREAMALGMEYAKRCNADLLLATDPDCDRVGVAVRDGEGEYVLLSGNETGVLLLDYICARRRENETMPPSPMFVKTIVTTDMATQVAAHYGVETVNVLTGFKYIGEQIGLLEKAGQAERYIFGFEESCGYLSGTYVRDKDAVGAAFLICEMTSFYRAQGMSLLDKLNALYELHGNSFNTLRSYAFEGNLGFERMRKIMASLRSGLSEIGPRAVLKCLDYSTGLDGLPRSDVLKYILEDNSSVVIRPSGTESKLKVYISVKAPNRAEAAAAESEIAKALEAMFG
ncbi:MAG TPA: phospho-sugar mutase [Candidatus Pullichristensenella stercorigallinarum]|uniref:phosphoglucomutase (alpha-D-glucose-1,6-bisphosphate-dependent) n=1 Tax=Candidatus Pullichristensenella stercorigallinarum TaxID=2840909 RepID=A0A9D1CW84_9FIRM|nr:phospho-sugar mutase [Candidatus Pullichristensenella stercorigallinarum]